MKTAVVYYSLTGNTQAAAEVIAGRLSADLVRIETIKPYPAKGFAKFYHGGKSAVFQETPALKPYDFNVAKYDLIILGFPIWAANLTPPIRSFVKENDLSGKKVAAFVCQSGDGGQKALRKLREVLPDRKLECEVILIDPKDHPDEHNDILMAAFCERLLSLD